MFDLKNSKQIFFQIKLLYYTRSLLQLNLTNSIDYEMGEEEAPLA